MPEPVFLGILTVAIASRIFWPNRTTACLFAITALGLAGFLVQRRGIDIAHGLTSARSQVETFVGTHFQEHPEHTWPPVVGEAYPDLQLIDQDGNLTSLSEFKGKVILLEPVGLPCEACIAFSGGKQRGAYDGVEPQQTLDSIDNFARRYGYVDLNRDDIVLVQVLFYNKRLTAPSPAEVRDWARHFGLERSDNRVVLGAEPYLLGPQTHAMIPGFQLIDKNFVLRYDSAGNSSRHNLYTELLPNIRRLSDE